MTVAPTVRTSSILSPFPLLLATVTAAPSRGGEEEEVQTYRYHGRRLPGGIDGFTTTVEDSIRQVLSTPINDWDGSQWMTALVLLSLVMWCCGCIRRGRRGGGGGNCIQNVLCCACCYELCCRDCQDLAPIFGGVMKPPATAAEGSEEAFSSSAAEYELHGGRLV